MTDEREHPTPPEAFGEGRSEDGVAQLPTQLPVPDTDAPRGWARRLLAVVFVATMLAAAVAPYVGAWLLPVPEPSFQHLQATPPDPVAPTGTLAKVYESARPATLRVEARCANGARRGALGIGTGFYVSAEGDVLTAYHVVESQDGGVCPIQYVGVEADGDVVELDLVGFDAYFDLAWMQADVETVDAFLPLAAQRPAPGDGVVAIGNSRGDDLAARAGRVVRLGVDASRADFADDTIELTAALAPGDSGGPVLNERGEAVGVVSYISFAPDAGTGGSFVPPFLRGLELAGGFASYAIPVTEGADLVKAVRAGEQRDVPVIGFSWRPGFDYDPSDGDRELGRRPGTIVLQVAPGGPAEASGLQSYVERPVYGDDGSVIDVERVADVIVAIDGEATPTFYDLLETVRRKRIGETVSLTVQRGRTTIRLDLELGAKRQVF